METGKIVEAEVTSNFLVDLRKRLISECEKEGMDNVICGFFIGDPETGDINTSLFGTATGEFITLGLTCLFHHIREEQYKQDNATLDEVIN